jgi:hypothetical protein
MSQFEKLAINIYFWILTKWEQEMKQDQPIIRMTHRGGVPRGPLAWYTKVV